MTHRSGYSASLQRELKVREPSVAQKLVNLSVGVATAAAVAMAGALSFVIIPH